MNHSVIQVALWSIVACSALLPSSACAAEVIVRLNDSRALRGSFIESHTNKEILTLELRASGITMRQRLSWKQVADVRVVGPEEVKHVIAPDAIRRISLKETDSVPQEDVTGSAVQPLFQLLVRAEPVSTFGKLDWDSLRLSLRGVDQRGDAVPLFGALRITLWGLRQEPGRLDQNRYGPLYHAVPRGVEEIGTWTRQVNSTYDSERGDISVLLPLTHPLPDHNARLASLGEVTVELLMPGVGVFSAAEPNVWLSHTGALSARAGYRGADLRQYLLDRDGTRFFPNEATTGSPQPFGSITNRALWPERRVLTIQP